ncbi:MAG: hypothetical protein ABJH98_04025 [Reichenbachiella sp.]|uniref:hypothetical protein n=1 Tax=Reichenbachiella sp. TaxID=2184521 RepID=UPI003298354A
MKILFCLLLIFLFISPSFGQEDTSPDWIKVLSYGVGNKTDQNVLSIEEANSRINQCTPPDFAYANLLLGNDSLVEQVIVKYDYKEKVLLIRHENQIIVGAPNMVKRVQFSDSSINELINVSELGRSYGRRGFYSIILEEGGNFLLKYYAIEGKENRKEGNQATLQSISVFEKKEVEIIFTRIEEYLIMKENELFVLENLKSKSLAKLGNQSEKLKSYVKENKIKYKNENDLKSFTEYFWSL